MKGALKNMLRCTTAAALATVLAVPAVAGNRDRTGQAGALELLINPWAATNGTFGANMASVHGLEAMKGNIGGLSFLRGTEVGVAYTHYISGSGVSVNNLAIGQSFGSAGAVGVNIQSMGFGSIEPTTYDDPEGASGGTFTPQFLNFQLGYAKEFSNAIHAGVAFTFVSENIATISAQGACIDAGVQYQTGKRNNFHFGVALRNVGTNMRFAGSGFTFDTPMPENGAQTFNSSIPSEKFQMPTYLNIAASYDFYLDENKLKNDDDVPKHRLTGMLAFTSNSFSNDYIHAGLEYGFKKALQLRAGYRYERQITDASNYSTFFTGFAAGATVATNLGKNGPLAMLDYSFRPTRQPANGVHAVALRLQIGGKKAPAPAADEE